MGIYTRTGDRGTTATLSGERHPKNHAIFEANGAVDELSAHLGLLRAGSCCLPGQPGLAAFLLALQRDLVQIGAYVSGGDASTLDSLVLSPEPFETVIDAVLAVRPIEQFIIPGENELEARFHVARTVCRRGERRLVELLGLRPDERALRYVNRLSDLLFALALWAREPFDLSLPSQP